MDTVLRPGAGSDSGNDITCPYCNAGGKALVGVEEQRRQRRIKCRKCDAEYWENQATGLVQEDRGNPGGE